MEVGNTQSVCPVCGGIVEAKVVEKSGKIFLEKECGRHGFFRVLYWGDAGSYGSFLEKIQGEVKVGGAQSKSLSGCPLDCGLCERHESQTVLAVVDVTQRCNLHCPVCFADAGTGGDLSFTEIEGILKGLRAVKPVPVVAVQFSGGEPTLRDDLPEIVSLARKKLGFIHPEVNTNGIRIALDLGYLKRLLDAGLKVIYLSFDGVDDAPYVKLRGRPLFQVKNKVVENCRKLGFNKVVLSVTLVKGVNDGEVGRIIDYAVRNRDVVRGVNFQPVALSGRFNLSEENRITTPDFMRLVEEQTEGKIKALEFHPVSSTVPLLKFIEAYTGVPRLLFSAHPCCGAGTYLFTDEDGGYKTLDSIIDLTSLEGLLQKAVREHESLKGRSKTLWKLKYGLLILLKVLPSARNKETRNLILRVLSQYSSKPLVHYAHKNTLLIGCMHFMDAGNFDASRARKCIIHYALPDGRRIPFCSYNTIHRNKTNSQNANKHPHQGVILAKKSV